MICEKGGHTTFRFPKMSLETMLRHAVFSRRGGFSKAPFESLNTSYSVGDVEGAVTKNLYGIMGNIGAAGLFFMEQCHGARAVIIRGRSTDGLIKIPDADALITNEPGMALMVKQADCQGVIIFDPQKEVLAVAHCGWRGNVLNILGKVVKMMADEFGASPDMLKAAIGPSLGPCCAEFITYQDIFPASFKDCMVRDGYFDLWSLSRRQLMDAGLVEGNIETARICTRCNRNLFYSYRGEAKTGRFATVAMLNK